MVIERIEAAGEPESWLRAGGLEPQEWSAGTGATFARHVHARAKRLFVLRGSISFDGLELAAGDGIRISPGHEHSAVAGPGGVRCVEAFEP